MKHELDVRLTAEGETVALVWDDESNGVELSVEDSEGRHRTVRVEGRKALDAFRHPYLYLASIAPALP
jgi:hypothetical protein